MNIVLMLAFNNLALTKEAVDSVLNQTIPTRLFLVNNGSTDGTREWADHLAHTDDRFSVIHYQINTSPCLIANTMLSYLLPLDGYILCLANDLVLAPDFYEELLKWPRGIVCGAEVRTLPLPDMKPYQAISENTPMSAMLIRRWAYDAVMARDGYFMDERFFHYCSDCDLALRVANCGIWGIQINVPYLHHVSATITNAAPDVANGMHQQANIDRAAFLEKWGFTVDSLEYGARAVDINFRGSRG